MEYLKKYWAYSLLSLIMSLAIQLILLIPPTSLSRLIDSYIPNKNMSMIYLSVLFMVGIPFLSTIMQTFYTYKVWLLIKTLSITVKNDVFKNILNQPISFFKNKTIGELVSYCNVDTADIFWFWILDIPELISQILTMIAIFVIMVKTSLPLFLIVLISLPTAILLSIIFGKHRRNKSIFCERNKGISRRFSVVLWSI